MPWKTLLSVLATVIMLATTACQSQNTTQTQLPSTQPTPTTTTSEPPTPPWYVSTETAPPPVETPETTQAKSPQPVKITSAPFIQATPQATRPDRRPFQSRQEEPTEHTHEENRQYKTQQIEFGYARKFPGERLPEITITTGIPFQLTAYATNSDGSYSPLPKLPGEKLQVTSNSPSWVTVHRENILLAERPGQAVITATLGKLSGKAIVRAHGPSKLKTLYDGAQTTAFVERKTIKQGSAALQVEAGQTWWEQTQDRTAPRIRRFPLTDEEKAHIVITNSNPSAVSVSKDWTITPTGTGRTDIALREGQTTLDSFQILSTPSSWDGYLGTPCTTPTENDPKTSYKANEFLVAFRGMLRSAEETAMELGAVVTRRPIHRLRKEYTFTFPCPGETQEQLLEAITSIKQKLEKEGSISYVEPVTTSTPETATPTTPPTTLTPTKQGRRKPWPGELTEPSTPLPQQGDHIVRIQAYPTNITVEPAKWTRMSGVRVHHADGRVEELQTDHQDLEYGIENPDQEWSTRTKTNHPAEPEPDPPHIRAIKRGQKAHLVFIPQETPTASLYVTVSYLGHTSQTRVDVRGNPPPNGPNTCAKNGGHTGTIMAEFKRNKIYDQDILAQYLAQSMEGHVKAQHPASLSYEISFPCKKQEDMEQALQTILEYQEIIRARPYTPTMGDRNNKPTGLVLNLKDKSIYVEPRKFKNIGNIRLAMSNGSITHMNKQQLQALSPRTADASIATVDPETWTVHGIQPGVTSLYLKHPRDITKNGAQVTINVIHQGTTAERKPKLIYIWPLPIEDTIVAKPGETVQIRLMKTYRDLPRRAVHPSKEPISFKSRDLPQAIDQMGNLYIPHDILRGESHREIRVTAHHMGLAAHKTILVIPHNTALPEVQEDCTYRPPNGEPNRKADTLAIKPSERGGAHGVGRTLSHFLDNMQAEVLGTQKDPLGGIPLTIVRMTCNDKLTFEIETHLMQIEGKAIDIKVIHHDPRTKRLTGISISMDQYSPFTHTLVQFKMRTHHQGGYKLTAQPQQTNRVKIISADPSIVKVRNGNQATTTGKAGTTKLTFNYMGQEDTKEITVIPPSLDKDCRLWTQAGYIDVEDIYYDIKGTDLTTAELILTKGLGRPMARRIARTARATLKEGHQGNIHAPIYTLNIQGIDCSARGLTDSKTILRLLSKWENEGKTDHNIHSLKTRTQTLTFHTRVWSPREDTWLPRLRYGQDEPQTKITGIQSYILNESPIFPLQYLEIIHASIYKNLGTIRMQPQDTQRLLITARDPGILKPADDAAHKNGQKVQHNPSQYASGKSYIQAIRPGQTELTIRLGNLETTLPVTISEPPEAHPEYAVHCTRTIDGITIAADQAIVRTKTGDQEARIAAFAAHSQGAIIKVSPDNRTYLLQLQCLPELVQPPTTPEFWQVESAHPHIIAIDNIPIRKGHNPEWQPSPPNLINKEMACNHNLKHRISPKYLAFDQQDKQDSLAVQIETGIEQVTKSTMHSECMETGLAAPRLHRPHPGQPGTCLAKDSTLKAETLPPSLKGPDGQPTQDHHIDQEGNALIHWAPDARPPDNAWCWVYSPRTGWKTYK